MYKMENWLFARICLHESVRIWISCAIFFVEGENNE